MAQVTRDLVQGFIDGYITTGGDPSKISVAVNQYLVNQPSYPQDQATADYIVSIIQTYRITPQNILAPTPVSLVPSQVQPPVTP